MTASPDEPTSKPDESATEATPGEPNAAESAPATEAAAPENPREALAWCREHATDDDALPRLNSLHEYMLLPEFADDVVGTAATIVSALVQQPTPGPIAQAHMIILLGELLQLTKQRDAVDLLLVSWMKHPSTFGSARATPPEFQRPEFVQRVADLIGWGTLDVNRDGEALGRFFGWVNTWAPKQKRDVRRTVEMLRRVFPSPELWKRVKLF